MTVTYTSQYMVFKPYIAYLWSPRGCDGLQKAFSRNVYSYHIYLISIPVYIDSICRLLKVPFLCGRDRLEGVITPFMVLHASVIHMGMNEPAKKRGWGLSPEVSGFKV